MSCPNAVTSLSSISWRTARRSVLPLSLVLLTAAPLALAASSASEDLRYREAIENARNSKLDDAAQSLQDLLAAHPTELRYRHDLVAVYAWQGSYAQAVALARGLSLDTTPLYVLQAWADAEKNTQNLDQAQAIYQAIDRREPVRLAIQISLAQLDILRDKAPQALARLQAVDADKLNPADRIALQEMLIRTWLALQDYPEAIKQSDELLAIAPANRTALEAKFVSNLRMDAPRLALATSLTLTPADRAAAKTAAISREIRWGRAEADNSRASSPTRWVTTDAAINSAQQHIDELSRNEPAGSDALLRQQYDLLVVLVDRRRNREAVDLYRMLQLQGAAIPAWLKIPAASAYLALRQPDMAIKLYEQAFAAKVGDFDAHVNYVYALLEAEHAEAAIAAADQLVADTPEWRNNAYPALRVENQNYPAAQLLAAQVRAFTEQLADAQRRVDDLHRRAPGNEDIAAAQADIDRLRGWPRRALTQLNRLHTLSPDYIWVIPPTFDAHMDTADFAAAATDLARAQLEMPDDSVTQRMERNWQDHLRPQTVTTLAFGRSGGGKEGLAGNGDVHDLMFDSRVYSSPFADNWRAYARAGWQQSTSNVENLLRRVGGAGLEYRSPDWSGETELDGANGSSGTAGGHVAVSYHPSDFWTVDLGYAHDGDDTPLRAFADGVHTDFTNTALRYRWSESREVGLVLSHGHFSDDNTRLGWGVYGVQRAVTQPYYQMDVRLDVGGMHNDLPATAANYFNPSSQQAGVVSVINHWVQWRQYERQLSHRLTLSAGENWQRSYGAATVGGAAYELEYQLNALLDWRIGTGINRAYYDGNGETDYSVHATLDWKF
ncbi:poly-beta-1,6 N-acetyl-D-glucosamine export porin PgaA [Silvimonas sp.]|uniref:poly-beta-1,6 N-acetyl-D-glucosamine export porin PgaA n=1 Tax=Silvimonas sp. TaxID=2650811 RepID=UPI00283E9741|nr:poly-beta-1,6 N-acetyl-D-glucosamine export porin PgaA [Silvimonas sp.]MDR3430180.1 poly-beta-1,6 N-acetyl-D-glucosamine export porin PgaA [Silvimonas sp.]